MTENTTTNASVTKIDSHTNRYTYTTTPSIKSIKIRKQNRNNYNMYRTKKLDDSGESTILANSIRPDHTLEKIRGCIWFKSIKHIEKIWIAKLYESSTNSKYFRQLIPNNNNINRLTKSSEVIITNAIILFNTTLQNLSILPSF